MDRMQIYQHVLTTYSNAQKSGKKVDLPPSIDKIVGVLSEVPDSQVLPVITMVVTCEQDGRVLDALQKLMKERGLSGGKASGKGKGSDGASMSGDE